MADDFSVFLVGIKNRYLPTPENFPTPYYVFGAYSYRPRLITCLPVSPVLSCTSIPAKICR